MTKRIAILGGGRWGRVLVQELWNLTRENQSFFRAELVWGTDRGRAAAAELVQHRGWKSVAVVPRGHLLTAQPHAAVVATSPYRHATDCQTFVQEGIPTLCEKPIATCYRQALELQQIATSAACPLGIELTFAYADFVRNFAKQLDGVSCERIEIQWHDPWSEQRYGETKRPDIYTDYVSDMFPHCWSVLRAIRPTSVLQPFDAVSYEPREVRLESRLDDGAAVHISLSRRAPARQRRVTVDNGRFVLDFSTEPGWTQHEGIRRLNVPPEQRPLSKSLADFLAVAAGDRSPQDWPVSLDRCLDSVRLAEQGAHLLLRAQERQLTELKQHRSPMHDYSPDVLALIVDTLLPQCAQNGVRPDAYLPSEQHQFARSITDV